tara:strand:+ start:4956 stop:7127 length:2172 start_codon:yes stop_codon:yes gene_type:complete
MTETFQNDLVREEGTLVDIVFRSPTTAWGIGVFRREDSTVFCATGDFGKTVLYEDFILYGKRVPDIEGGDIEVKEFTSRPPRSVAAISGYLTSLTGASRGATSKLVAHFGAEVIEILERSPEAISAADIPQQDMDRLISGWRTQRSDRLAMSKIEVEGIQLYKLSRLQRYYGNEVDLNKLIKADPYCLYIHFEDMPFAKAVALANKLGVTNQSESAVRGAVIAALRREAWLGHSVIEGAQLGQTVVKLLKVHPDMVRPLLAPAVAELRKHELVHVEDRKIQLIQLHEAEHTLFKLIEEWSLKEEQDLDLDLVPSMEMGLKMLKPLKKSKSDLKALYTGLSALLSECFAIVQCQTFNDQIHVAKALSLICQAYGAQAIITTYTLEMLAEAETLINLPIPVMTYAELIGLDAETGIPLARAASPVEADIIIVIGADALGIEEMNHLIEAAPQDGRLYLLGCPKDLPSLSVGQPFADLMESNVIKAFHSRFWGVSEADIRLAQEQIWDGSLEPDTGKFDPTQPICWVGCENGLLPEFVPELLDQLAKAFGVNPLNDIRVVAPATNNKLIRDVINSIATFFAEDPEPVLFQNRKHHAGLPIVVRQPLATSDCPAFSVYNPVEISSSEMKLVGSNGAQATIHREDRIDVFDAVVMTPKFIRGRRYQVVVLIALEAQKQLINQELLSSLLNASNRSLVIVGDIEGLCEGLTERESSRSRSKLLHWVGEK